MKTKALFIVIAIAAMVFACSPDTGECPEVADCPACPEADECPDCPECEQCQECQACEECQVCEKCGPCLQWTVLDVIAMDGFYLVPEEAPYGQWVMEGEDPSAACYFAAFSDLDAVSDNRVKANQSEGRAFFQLGPEVRMVDFHDYSVDCTWTRIGD